MTPIAAARLAAIVAARRRGALAGVGRACSAATARSPGRSTAPRRAGRNLELARLGVAVGSTYASTDARKLFASAERRVELDDERAAAHAPSRSPSGSAT